jgi:hypothetical protein
MEESTFKSGEKPAGTLKPEDCDEFQDLISHFQEEENKSRIANLLAARIHLERLVERYWERKTKEEQSEQTSDETGAEEQQQESLEELRLRILQHPIYSTSPTVFRWPVSISQLAKPEWSLADEVLAIFSRQSVIASKPQIKDSKQSTAEEEDVVQPSSAIQDTPTKSPPADGIEDEGSEDEISTSVALSTISHCKTSLQFLLDSLSNRIPIGRSSGQKRMHRRDIITWRDVLKSIKNLPEPSLLPKEVVQSIEERIHAIAGSAEIFPSPAILTKLGNQGGALTKILQNQAPILTHQSEKSNDLSLDSDQTEQGNSLQKRLREIDQDLLLTSTSFKHSLLQPAPFEQILYKYKRQKT